MSVSCSKFPSHILNTARIDYIWLWSFSNTTIPPQHYRSCQSRWPSSTSTIMRFGTRHYSNYFSVFFSFSQHILNVHWYLWAAISSGTRQTFFIAPSSSINFFFHAPPHTSYLCRTWCDGMILPHNGKQSRKGACWNPNSCLMPGKWTCRSSFKKRRNNHLVINEMMRVQWWQIYDNYRICTTVWPSVRCIFNNVEYTIILSFCGFVSPQQSVGVSSEPLSLSQRGRIPVNHTLLRVAQSELTNNSKHGWLNVQLRPLKEMLAGCWQVNNHLTQNTLILSLWYYIYIHLPIKTHIPSCWAKIQSCQLCSWSPHCVNRQLDFFFFIFLVLLFAIFHERLQCRK